MAPRKPSTLWKWYTIVSRDGNYNNITKCNLCDKKLRQAGGSTTGLKVHLK